MERREQIDSLFREALQRPEAEREAFLRQACSDDVDMLREVQALADVGPYQITSFIAAGGMGAVYRALDPRMGREVAIKVAGERFSERFSREVHAVAALNHPNICHLYDVGPNYLVMELVEGESPRGPLPLETALSYARQIADALEEAHEKGIVHRDLKPGNIKIRPDGTVKVLDFGLAQIGMPSGKSAVQGEDSPTLTMAATQAGVILGTAAYMSPEQARGKPVDKRADIWAFGVVLYEMLTGKRLFEGEDLTETLASVVKDAPRLDEAPASVRRLLGKCLEKDPKKRLRDIGDVWEFLEDAPAGQGPTLQAAHWWIGAVLLAIVAVALWAPWRKAPPAPDVKRYQIPGAKASRPFSEFVVSPDGRYLAYEVWDSSGSRLWLHSLESLDAHAVPGSEEGRTNGSPVYPFWSPDSRYVAFVSGTKLRKLNISNGSVQTICEVSRGRSVSGSWNRDGVILVADEGSILRVNDTGGALSVVVAPHGAEKLGGYFPYLLPDGRHFLYHGGSTEFDVGGIYIGSLDATPETQDSKPLLSSETAAIFAADPDQRSGSPSGYLLFGRERTLLAQGFDAKRLRVMGEAAPVSDEIERFGILPSYSSSTNGVLIYRAGAQTALAVKSQVTRFDRKGNATGILGDPGMFRDAQFSPDGKRVVLDTEELASSGPADDLWISDLKGIRMRLTFGPGSSTYPVWSPDGSAIAFQRSNGRISRKAADGAGEEQALLVSGQRPRPTSWSHDGRYLLYDVQAEGKTNRDIWVLPMEGDTKPFPFLSTPANEFGGSFSPDGRWVAYVSNETGTYEIYVRPFPPSSHGKWLISKGSDSGLPHWRQDGKELNYVAADRSVISVPVTANPMFQAGEPQALFTLPSNAVLRAYAPDSNLLLVSVPIEATAPEPFTVVLNWTSLLKK